MKQLQVLFSNEVMLEDERRMILDYSLTEKSSDSDQKLSCYGIQITKHLDNLIESEEIGGISYSKDTAVSILKKLCMHKVTPISMVEIVDDLVTEGF